MYIHEIGRIDALERLLASVARSVEVRPRVELRVAFVDQACIQFRAVFGEFAEAGLEHVAFLESLDVVGMCLPDLVQRVGRADGRGYGAGLEELGDDVGLVVAVDVGERRAHPVAAVVGRALTHP